MSSAQPENPRHRPSSAPEVGAATHFSHVYEDLHRLARRWFRSQPRGHTLQPTALVHEVYLRMARQSPEKWRDRSHFAAIAATAMRQIMISHERRRRALQRGHGWTRLPLSELLDLPGEAAGEDLRRLPEALETLERLHPRQSRVIELRFLRGLTVKETARVMHIAERTVKLDSRIGRAWLQRRLEERE